MVKSLTSLSHPLSQFSLAATLLPILTYCLHIFYAYIRHLCIHFSSILYKWYHLYTFQNFFWYHLIIFFIPLLVHKILDEVSFRAWHFLHSYVDSFSYSVVHAWLEIFQQASSPMEVA